MLLYLKRLLGLSVNFCCHCLALPLEKEDHIVIRLSKQLLSFVPGFIEIEPTYNIVFVYGIQHNELIHVYTVNDHNKLTSTASHSYNFFLKMRTFKIYSPSNFKIYNTVLLSIATTLHL